MMHIYNRVASPDKDEDVEINELLNLDSDITNEDRATELKKLLYERLVTNIQKVNTEEDVINELKKRSHLNDIPLIVKRYFGLLK